MWKYIQISVLFLCLLSTAYSEIIHEVQRGDTLYSISKKYGISVEELQASNDIGDPSSLALGMELMIPHLYKVRKGDTLYSIAREQSSSVAMIQALNQLEGESIFEGMTLLIPDQHGHGVPADISSTVSTAHNPTWPVSGPRSPLQGKFPGIAISAQEEEVMAVRAGRVIYVGPHSSFRHVVLIQSSSGHVYVYAGQAQSYVRTGEYVQAGSVIGQLSSGEDTHTLYFSVWKNNLFVNPSQAPRG